MGITQITPQREIETYLQKQLKNKENALIYRLASIAAEVVNLAKTSRGYIDKSSNLCSSTGFVIVKDGKVINGKFETTNGKGEEGVKEGEKFAEKIASEMPHGIGIVVVAGMNYAAYVEAKGFNVLAVSEIKAKQLVKEMFEQLKINK